MEDKQFIVQDQPDLTLPEDRIFKAFIDEIKSETVNYKDKVTREDKTFDKLTWWFLVDSDDEYAGRKVKGETDAKITNHPNNRFRNWAEAALGRDLGVGVALSLSDLQGLPVEITVRHEPDKKDPAKVWERVGEVLPTLANSKPPF